MSDWAMDSVFSTFRPTMQALAPRWTIARTWALQMLPLPPVQKTTLLSIMVSARIGYSMAGVAY